MLSIKRFSAGPVLFLMPGYTRLLAIGGCNRTEREGTDCSHGGRHCEGCCEGCGEELGELMVLYIL